MIKNYFKIAWRNIIRHKGYSAINVAGLSIGIAACLLIFVVIQYELSFDTFQPNFNNTYRIVTQIKRQSDMTYNPGVAIPASDALRLDFPQAKIAAINSIYGSQVTVPGEAGNDKKFIESTGIVIAEPQYFDLFASTWLAGKPSVLSDPNMVVIDKSSAAKYFGSWKNAMGKALKLDNVLTLKVAGIVDDAPSNTDFPLKIFVSYITWKQNKTLGYNADWGSVSSDYQAYMLFPQGTSINTINKQLKDFSAKHLNGPDVATTLHMAQPLSAIHFDTRFSSSLGDHITNKATLKTLSFIAILIIIMASINFINLSTAQSVGRSKEVGIRKVLGSSQGQLVIQIIGETTIIVFVSLVIALLAAKIALPYLKNIANVPDNIGLFNTGSIIFLACTTLVVILLSGLYPALIVSGFKPALALKNKITAASIGGISLRRGLVVAQFAISQLLIIGTIVAVSQMDFVNNADLGFNKDALLIIPGSEDTISLHKMQAFKQQLLQNPNVQSVTFVTDPPSSDNNRSTNFYFNNSNKDPGFHLYLKVGDADYFKTFGLRFAAGKGFDVSDTMRQAVVNQTLVRKLGMQRDEDAIGKTIRFEGNKWAPIVGVVKDFKTNSLRENVRPAVIFTDKSLESTTAVKIHATNLSQAVASVQKLWEKTYPEYAYNGFFLDDNIAKFYKQENQLALVYKIFAGIAIFISCLGLYGLVSFMAVQRTKEVGIRKVLGASVSSVVFLFSKEFIVLIIISFVIAMPAAWYIMSGWLRNFAYRIPLHAWIFVLAIVSSIIIACLTVGYKAIRAALVNPVESLRSE